MSPDIIQIVDGKMELCEQNGILFYSEDVALGYLGLKQTGNKDEERLIMFQSYNS